MVSSSIFRNELFQFSEHRFRIAYLCCSIQVSLERQRRGHDDTNPQQQPDNIENILSAPKGNEQLIIKQLNDSQEINQAELAVRIGIPKSTLSRTLSDMERRKLIVRYDSGMSKMVKLADSLKKNR